MIPDEFAMYEALPCNAKWGGKLWKTHLTTDPLIKTFFIEACRLFIDCKIKYISDVSGDEAIKH